MKYTVIPGVILTKIWDEDFLVATGPARGRVPYVEGINSTGAYFFSKILDGLSTEEIIEDAVKLYETPKEVIAPSFERFIESLLRSSYLEKSELWNNNHSLTGK